MIVSGSRNLYARLAVSRGVGNGIAIRLEQVSIFCQYITHKSRATAVNIQRAKRLGTPGIKANRKAAPLKTHVAVPNNFGR